MQVSGCSFFGGISKTKMGSYFPYFRPSFHIATLKSVDQEPNVFVQCHFVVCLMAPSAGLKVKDSQMKLSRYMYGAVAPLLIYLFGT